MVEWQVAKRNWLMRQPQNRAKTLTQNLRAEIAGRMRDFNLRSAMRILITSPFRHESYKYCDRKGVGHECKCIDINVAIVKGFINSPAREGSGIGIEGCGPTVVLALSAINHLIDINELKFALFRWGSHVLVDTDFWKRVFAKCLHIFRA